MLHELHSDNSKLIFSKNPFPHFSISEVFSPEVAETLLSWLNLTNKWTLSIKDFYTQFEFSLLNNSIPDELNFLKEDLWKKNLCKKVESIFNTSTLEVIEVTAHKLVKGHRMGIHNDYLNELGIYRLVIQLNLEWQTINGGYLMLFNSKNPQDVSKIIQPLHNTAIGFEISPCSYHAVSTVYDFIRYTLVYTFKKIND